MSFVIVLKVRQRGTPGIARKKMNAIKKEVWHTLGTYWHANLRPKHFTHAGAREYFYQPRQGERGNIGRRGFKSSYTARKLRQFGHTLPLVYTGTTRTLSRVRNVQATSRGVKVRLNTPALNFRPKSGIMPSVEMTRISESEQNTLKALFEQQLIAKLNQIHDTVTETI